MHIHRHLNIHSVTMKFPNRDHKNRTKKEKLILSLGTVTASFGTNSIALIRRIECPTNASSGVAFSSLVTVCWIDKTASNLVPSIAILNLGNKVVSRL
jgi:hypothetical protein